MDYLTTHKKQQDYWLYRLCFYFLFIYYDKKRNHRIACEKMILSKRNKYLHFEWTFYFIPFYIMQKNIIIGWIGVWLLVVTWLIYALSSNNYLENMQEMRKYECSLRSEKQEILDWLSYSQSIQFARWEFTHKRIIEIDWILKSWISQASDCPWINYNWISFVSKAQADDNTEEIKHKIKINSNEWVVLDEEIGFRQSRQWELHEENNMLRDYLPKLITHNWYSKDSVVQEYVNYAYKVWWMDLVKLMECENWQRNPKTKWDWGKSIWFCQIHLWYHTPPNEFFTDWKVQIEYCNQKRIGWTKFYWPTRIVKWQKCSDYVDTRFSF